MIVTLDKLFVRYFKCVCHKLYLFDKRFEKKKPNFKIIIKSIFYHSDVYTCVRGKKNTSYVYSA